MKNSFKLLVLVLLIQSCEEPLKYSSIDPVSWNKRTVTHVMADSLDHGTTYLSIYSEIYSQTEHVTHNLTATISMRNTNRTDTIYIDKAEYFNTTGHLIRTYFDQKIYVAPMETVEIVIDQGDQHGGSGANFLFEWSIRPNTHEPLFEGVMISTSGQQGLSFTTTGKRVE